ncbi:MAG TPA: hypothetical protein VH302_04520 [Bryobacteraceae bacterium]|nr:hypothetical protein [Bryobacteraceae bacterium]
MQIKIVPYSADGEDAARNLNQRLRAGGELEFQLPEHTPPEPPANALIRNSNFLAFEGEAVRGGFLLASFPAAFSDGQEATVINCREPISEGTVDGRYSLLALQLMKYMQQQGPYLFALGMGSEQARFTRLLKSAGWTIEPVPFLFRVINANRFVLNIKQLQNGSRRTLALAAAWTGAAKIGITALQAKSISAKWRANGYTIERVTSWGAWADVLWERFRRTCSFCVKRDRATLEELYNLGRDRSMAFLAKRSGTPVGWLAAQNTHFTDHKYFGAMRVATILDCIALPEAIDATIALGSKELARDRSDLIVTNQSFQGHIDAFRANGFLKGPSNYILATSKGLTSAIASQPGGRKCTHFTRGDGDGRDHL